MIYLGTAAKSNASYRALGRAMQAARETGSLMPPKHILNAPTRLMKELGYSEGYVYDHDTEEGFSGQNYFLPKRCRGRASTYRAKRGFEAGGAESASPIWQKLREGDDAGSEDEA